MKGPYVACEGIDACGKDTQADMMAELLEQLGYAVVRGSLPDETNPCGALTRGLLGQSLEGVEARARERAMAFQFFAGALWTDARLAAHFEQVPDAAAVWARGILSSIVYQQDVWGVDMLLRMQSTLSVVPDVIFVLDVSADTVSARTRTVEMYDSTRERLETYRGRYLRFFDNRHDSKLFQFGGRFTRLFKIDGERDAAAIHAQVRSLLDTWFRTTYHVEMGVRP